jgi:pilus assembly protein Flp/PilA
MRKFLGTLKKFGKDEEGAALVEYVVLLGVLLGVSIGVITGLGTQIAAVFTNITGLLTPLV